MDEDTQRFKIEYGEWNRHPASGGFKYATSIVPNA